MDKKVNSASMSNKEMYIECKNVTLGYGTNVVAENISFRVDKGDYLCIVGENGAGKSTLMKTILKLNKPLGGEIRYSDSLGIGDIGFLPQQTPVQKDFPASVHEVVMSGNLSHLGKRFFYSKADKERARSNMEKMGIWDFRNRCYRELSGGQQQRVMLARALCATEKVLLLDEPVSGLDPVVTGEMYELIEKLNKEGITIIMISHDIGSAIRYASHILHIGKNVGFFGTKEDYLDSEAKKSFERGNDNDR
jgi:zinc transport system ATP-binding protein